MALYINQQMIQELQFCCKSFGVKKLNDPAETDNKLTIIVQQWLRVVLAQVLLPMHQLDNAVLNCQC
jgi:hypothetical protein